MISTCKSLNKLDLGVAHGFESGDKVVYRSQGVDIGLVEGRTYTVTKVNDTTIKLRDGANLVDFDPTAFAASGAHAFDFLSSNAFNAATAISDKKESITLGRASRVARRRSGRLSQGYDQQRHRWSGRGRKLLRQRAQSNHDPSGTDRAEPGGREFCPTRHEWRNGRSPLWLA